MGRIGSVRCEKSWCDFRARTFVLIAPVHPVLHWVSCSYEMIPNAPKHYTTHQNMRLGSNGGDWVRSLWKIPTWLRGSNFCFNCTSSLCFASSLMQLWNDPKCTKTMLQRIKTWVYGPMGRIGCVRSEKFRCDFMARPFVLIAPVHPVLHRVSCSYVTNPNVSHQNISLGSNGMDRVCSLRKNYNVTLWHELLH